MDELLVFLRARFDEAEQHARKDLAVLDAATNRGDWRVRYGMNAPSEIWAGSDLMFRLPASETDGGSNGDAMLVARAVRTLRCRAEQMLAEVAAKRQIIADLVTENPNEVTGVGWDGGWWYAVQAVLQILALPYAGHPDYRKELRPT